MLSIPAMTGGREPDYRHVTFGRSASIDPRSARLSEDLRQIDAHLQRNRRKLEEAKRLLEEFRARHPFDPDSYTGPGHRDGSEPAARPQE